ncbi:MAG: hypothetical protein JST68_08590 [Bacteroidetes bacterium]|nr:hypothetical protein [Bacteroidota bacterium]
MLKYPVTILLIVLIALQTFSKWCLIAEFQVNRDFIAKNLCVNRFNACSCCKGKCYLNKKIAEDESQQQAPIKGGQREETLLQTHVLGKMLPEPVCFVVSVFRSTRYIDSPSQEYLASSFEPPQA